MNRHKSSPMSLFLLFCSLIMNKINLNISEFLFFQSLQFLVAALSPKISGYQDLLILRLQTFIYGAL